MFFLENIGKNIVFQIISKIKQHLETCFGNLRRWRIVPAILDCLDSLSEAITCKRPMSTKMERWTELIYSLPGSCICLKSEMFHINEHQQNQVVPHSWFTITELANKVLPQPNSYLKSLWIIKNLMQHCMKLHCHVTSNTCSYMVVNVQRTQNAEGLNLFHLYTTMFAFTTF